MEDRHDLIRQFTRIELNTLRHAGGFRPGVHHSPFRAEGLEFSEIREYVCGDDIRSIDWNVTARYNHPFIKEYTGERDQTFYLVADISGSGTFGSEKTKQRTIAELVATLGFSAIAACDRVGLCLFSDRVEKFIPAKSGKKHLVRILNTVIDHKPVSKKTDLNAATLFLAKTLPRRSSIIILSDFLSPSFGHSLAVLHRHHEVIAIRVMDLRERELPDVGYIEFEDPETGEQMLADTSDTGFRARYRELVADAERDLCRDLAKKRIPHLVLTTGEPYGNPLKRFFLGLPGRRRYHAGIL